MLVLWYTVNINERRRYKMPKFRATISQTISSSRTLEIDPKTKNEAVGVFMNNVDEYEFIDYMTHKYELTNVQEVE
jgi:hypothetical protein